MDSNRKFINFKELLLKRRNKPNSYPMWKKSLKQTKLITHTKLYCIGIND